MATTEHSAAVVTLSGHLSVASLERELARATLPSEARGHLIVDVSAMTAYDADARARFIEWHHANKGKLGAVAIVGAKPLWRMVIHAMSLAAGVPMKPVATLDEARSWLASQ